MGLAFDSAKVVAVQWGTEKLEVMLSQSCTTSALGAHAA